MDFIQHISTDANTLETSPKVTTLKLTRGRLSGGWIFFPSGPAGKLHLSARIGIHQIFPFNVGQNIALDDCVVPMHFGIDLREPPFEIWIDTWNSSTEYAHVLTVCFSLIPKGKKKYNLDELINEFAGTNGYPKP